MNMSQADIQRIATEAAHAAATRVLLDRVAHDKTAVQETVKETLIILGIGGDPLEVQKDMQHLRAWRQSVEGVQQKTIYAMVGIVASGIIAAFWVGFKEFVSK